MNLKELLWEKRIKQCELAKALCLDPSQVSLFVNNWKPVPPKHINKISELLNLSESQVKELKKNTEG